MSEMWLPMPVQGLEQRYEISNLGNVRSLVSQKGKRTIPRLLKLWINRNGYPMISLSFPRKEKQISVSIHRMVLMAFVGPQPSSNHQAAHLDGNPRNSCLENLSWVTAKENQAHRHKHQTALIREKNHQSKLNNLMAKAAVKLHRKYKWSYAEIGQLFDVKYQTIQKICRKDTVL